jgi:hypothetical protein
MARLICPETADAPISNDCFTFQTLLHREALPGEPFHVLGLNTELAQFEIFTSPMVSMGVSGKAMFLDARRVNDLLPERLRP